MCLHFLQDQSSHLEMGCNPPPIGKVQFQEYSLNQEAQVSQFSGEQIKMIELAIIE